MRRAMAVVAVLAAALLTGCGDEKSTTTVTTTVAATTPAATTPAATTPPPATTPSSPAGDEDVDAIVRVTKKYLRAFAENDPRAACQTRTRAEREAFADDGLTCTDALRLVMKKVGASRSLFKNVKVRRADVTVDGDRATVTVDFPFTDDEKDKEDPLRLVRERGRWLLYDDEFAPEDEDDESDSDADDGAI